MKHATGSRKAIALASHRHAVWLGLLGCLACNQQGISRASPDSAEGSLPDSAALAKDAIDSFFAAVHEVPRARSMKVVGFKRDQDGFHLQLEVVTEGPTFGGGARVSFDRLGRFVSIELHQ